MILIVEMINYYLKNDNNTQFSESTKKMIDFITKICILFVLFIPLLSYTVTIMRLPREFLVYIYVAISCILPEKIIVNKKIDRIIIIMYSLISMTVFVWIQGFITSINNTERTYIPVLNNNYLLEIFINK